MIKKGIKGLACNLTLKTPSFGLRNGKIVSVDEVDSGLACDCLCPACHQPLVAKKGAIKAHHFSHAVNNSISRDHNANSAELYSAPDCPYALETAIHLMSKQIIKDECRMTLPALHISVSRQDRHGKTHTLERTLFCENRETPWRDHSRCYCLC